MLESPPTTSGVITQKEILPGSSLGFKSELGTTQSPKYPLHSPGPQSLVTVYHRLTDWVFVYRSWCPFVVVCGRCLGYIHSYNQRRPWRPRTTSFFGASRQDPALDSKVGVRAHRTEGSRQDLAYCSEPVSPLPSPDKVIADVFPMEANGGYSLVRWGRPGHYGDTKVVWRKPTTGPCNNGRLLHDSTGEGRAAKVEWNN